MWAGTSSRALTRTTLVMLAFASSITAAESKARPDVPSSAAALPDRGHLFADVTPMQSPAPAMTVAFAPARSFKITDAIAAYDKRDPIVAAVSEGNDSLPNVPLSIPAALASIYAVPAYGGPEPFGLYGFSAPDGTLTRKWVALSAQIQIDVAAIEACRQSDEACQEPARRFLRLADAARSLNGRERLEHVSQAVNMAVRYVSDFAHYGVVDRWSGPLETLGGAGDCEDYAILKDLILADIGVPAADRRIVFVRDLVAGVDHAVLGVRDGGSWVILDNKAPYVTDDRKLKHYLPLAAIGEGDTKLLANSVADAIADRTVAPAGTP